MRELCALILVALTALPALAQKLPGYGNRAFMMERREAREYAASTCQNYKEGRTSALTAWTYVIQDGFSFQQFGFTEAEEEKLLKEARAQALAEALKLMPKAKKLPLGIRPLIDDQFPLGRAVHLATVFKLTPAELGISEKELTQLVRRDKVETAKQLLENYRHSNDYQDFWLGILVAHIRQTSLQLMSLTWASHSSIGYSK